MAHVRKFWHLLMDMQSLIDSGIAPNAAAEKLADKHWRSMPSPRYESCVAWFKRNQRQFLDELKDAASKERVDRMFERMQKENRREVERWLEEHGTSSAIALLDLERMFAERDRESPGWRARWRKRHRRDPDDVLEFFRSRLRPDPEEADEDADEHPVAERLSREPAD